MSSREEGKHRTFAAAYGRGPGRMGDFMNKLTPLYPPREQQHWRPKVVCLVGSTRFEEEYREVERMETLSGCIVLTCGLFKSDMARMAPGMAESFRAGLDDLHLHKIILADEVFVVNPGNYIGESTAREINFARAVGRPIRWWSTPAGETYSWASEVEAVARSADQEALRGDREAGL